MIGSRFDSLDYGERKVEVVSKVEAMRSESSEKLLQQCDWTVPKASKTEAHNDGTIVEYQRASRDMREQNWWWCFLFPSQKVVLRLCPLLRHVYSWISQVGANASRCRRPLANSRTELEIVHSQFLDVTSLSMIAWGHWYRYTTGMFGRYPCLGGRVLLRNHTPLAPLPEVS